MTRCEAVSSRNPTESPGCRCPGLLILSPVTLLAQCPHTRSTVVLDPLEVLEQARIGSTILEFHFRSVRFSIFPKLGKHGVGRKKKIKKKKQNFSLSHPREACQRVCPVSCWLDACPHPQKPRPQRRLWGARASAQPGGLPSSPGHFL